MLTGKVHEDGEEMKWMDGKGQIWDEDDLWLRRLAKVG